MEKTKKRQLVREIYRAKENLSDQDIFLDKAYASYQSQIADGITEKYRQGTKVSIINAAEDGAPVAYTDGNTIVLNAFTNAIRITDRVDRHTVITGENVHECGHILYTDFRLGAKASKKLSTEGMLYPEPEIPQDEMKEFLNKHPEMRGPITNFYDAIDNCIEDGHIEKRLLALLPGYGKALEVIRNKFRGDEPSFLEMKNKGWEPSNIMTSLVLSQAKYGSPFIEESANQEELVQLFYSFAPMIDEAVNQMNAYERKRQINGVFVQLFQLIKKIAEEQQKKQEEQSGRKGNDSSQDGSNQDQSSDGNNQDGEGQSQKGNNSGQGGDSQNQNGNDQGSNDQSQGSNDNSQDQSGDGNGQNGKQDGKSQNQKGNNSSQNTGNQSQSGSCNSQNQDASGTPQGGGSQSLENALKQALDSASKQAEGMKDRTDHSSLENRLAPLADSKEKNSLKNQQSERKEESKEEKDKNKEKSKDTQKTGDTSSSALDHIADQIAKEKANEEMEKKLRDSLREDAKEISNDIHHLGITPDLGRMSVTERAKENYEARHGELNAVARRMMKNLLKEIKDRQLGDAMTGCYFGNRINSAELYRRDKKLYIRDVLPEDIPDMEVCILVDMSGSMSTNGKLDAAMNTAYVVWKFCQMLKMPVSVIGHNVCMGGHVNIESFADRDSLDGGDGIRIFGMSPAGRNRDGYALRYAIKHLKKSRCTEKLLLVISDGLPNDGSTYGRYEGKMDIQDAVAKARKSGMMVVTAGIGNSAADINQIWTEGVSEKRRAQFLEIPTEKIERLSSSFVRIIKKQIS